MLSQQQLEELASQIQMQIDSAEQEIVRLEEVVKPISPENAIGRVSRMEAINSKSINETGLRQARERVIDLKNALTRLNDDSFGICVKCGNPIPLRRILLMPETRACVKCLS